MTGSFDLPVQDWLDELQAGLKSVVIEGSDALLEQTLPQIKLLWQSNPNRHYEQFNPSEYARLMGCLDELVKDKTTAVAGQAPAPGSPMFLWLLNQAQDFTPEQLLLLGQILIHLPGLNLRMLLLHRGSPAPKSWTDATRGQTRIYNYEHLDVPTPDPVLNMAPAQWPAGDSPTSEPENPRPPIQTAVASKSGPRRWPWHLLTASIFLAAGWGLGRWTTPQRVETEVFIEVAPTQASTASIEEKAPAESTSENNTKAEPIAEMVDDELIRLTKRPLLIPSETLLAEQASVNSPVATTEKSLPKTPTPPAPVPTEKPALKSRFEAVQGDIQWLMGLSTEQFVVAHGTFKSLENARKLKNDHSELAQARIIPVVLNGQPAYTVITGPFKSQERAQTNLQQLTWSEDGKALSVARIRRLLDAALHRVE